MEEWRKLPKKYEGIMKRYSPYNMLGVCRCRYGKDNDNQCVEPSYTGHYCYFHTKKLEGRFGGE